MTPLGAWIGRRETSDDVVTPSLLARFTATFDMAASDVLPALGHWCLCLPAAATSELGADGHPRRGAFLPPVELPRRMWAGGRVEWFDELREGDEVRRLSTVADLREKDGRSGPLVFVTVGHELFTPRGLAIRERQDIVYRGPGASPAAGEQADRGDWSATVTPSEVLLFRYGALTFNAHRIHHDVPYATGVEGYDGLVVHGPLLATLLAASAVSHSGRSLASFEFRATKPVIAPAPFDVCGARAGEGAALWIRDAAGHRCMAAEATLAA
jgi:3-methylfumaryl-CoA hydratase